MPPTDIAADALLTPAAPRRRPAPAAPAVARAPDKSTVGVKTWIAVFGSVLGAFMAVLNTQIVNSSLPNIQGGIGAGIDEGGWVSTAYLIGEIVVIPLSAFLSQVFSLRRYLIVNAMLFLIFSAACASAQNLGQMIALRALQGFAGGVLIPLSFTIIITMLPKAKQAVGLALFAVTATFAPAIGPTIGGYLTENYGWQYIFYINIVPGVVMVAMLWYALDPAPMKLSLLKNGDWLGIATMAIGLSAIQTVLEEGNKDDWFGSPLILRLSIIAAVSAALFIWIEMRVANPLINLRLLGRRNFGFGSVANVMLGVVLYGSVYLTPLYLSQMQGYNAEQIGSVMMWIGLPQLVLIPLVPKLMQRVDSRLVAGAGFALFAASNFMNLHFSGNTSGAELFWPNIVRALGQALVMTPLSAIATSGIERENAGSASGLFNMMRNLGGAVGIAVLETFLAKREQFHSNVITGDVTMFGDATRNRVEMLKQYFLAHGVSDPDLAWHNAIVAIGHRIQQQAYFLAYSDCFLLLGAALVLGTLSVALLKRSESGGGGGAH